MASKTPSFIHELPLMVRPFQAVVLEKRLDAARGLYNVCLAESLKRLKRLRDSRLYRQAKATGNKKQRREYFKLARNAAGFNEYDLHSFAIQVKNQSYIAHHLDANTTQKVATRAFKATDQYAYGKRGRPRFKGANQFHSVEGKNNTSGIRFKEGRLVWSGLEIPIRYDKNDKHGVQAHALNQKTKYVRIVRRSIKGQFRWYVQLVQAGLPKQKYALGQGISGVDIGPSSIAVVSDKTAFLQPFCPEIDTLIKDKQRLQRAMDRSRRNTNPDHYRGNGTVIPGKKVWRYSKRYLQLKHQLSELERVLSVRRKQSHHRLVRKILSDSNAVKLEKLSYRAFQKLFGKSTGSRAPGLFIETLKRKAESAGGSVIEFSTYKTKLSQACQCGRLKKKSLSERWHQCDCGVLTQRDLYSAFLASHVENDSLNRSQALKAWADVEVRLGQALLMAQQSANSWFVKPASLGLNARGRADRLSQSERTTDHSSDGVTSVLAESESTAEAV